jgi:hypothetical protein
VSLEAGVVVVGVLATVIGVAALTDRLSAGARAPASSPRAGGRSRPNQLLRIERIVERSAESGAAVHTQLRPVLLEIVCTRLARRGLLLDHDSEHARRLLHAATWELIRPDRAPPQRDGPGIAPRALETVLEDLEAL